jgi:hypothetical protein
MEFLFRLKVHGFYTRYKLRGTLKEIEIEIIKRNYKNKKEHG